MSDLGQKIIAETRKVAANNPHFVYQKIDGSVCRYIHNDGPSCLIGHALWNLKLIDADWLGDFADNSAIEAIINDEGWQLEVGEINWLSIAQDVQDRGGEWGTSINEADEYLQHN